LNIKICGIELLRDTKFIEVSIVEKFMNLFRHYLIWVIVIICDFEILFD